ncbi:hypothetical protein OL548_26045 [Lysinibacillus sp. MHQ-1]|nr:hypothetical protein OL548_26045 [Lysinibacillus sp. MHQ-1]
MNMIRTWTGQQDELRAEKIDKAAVLELKIKEAKKMQMDLSEDKFHVTQKLAQIDEIALQDELQKIHAKKKGYLQRHDSIQAQRLEHLAEEKITHKATDC